MGRTAAASSSVMKSALSRKSSSTNVLCGCGRQSVNSNIQAYFQFVKMLRGRVGDCKQTAFTLKSRAFSILTFLNRADSVVNSASSNFFCLRRLFRRLEDRTVVIGSSNGKLNSSPESSSSKVLCGYNESSQDELIFKQ